MQFKEVLRRVTGVSVPIFGIQWDPPVDQVRLAQKVLDTLLDRRALYVDLYRENQVGCVGSAQDMRQNLQSLMNEAPTASPVYKITKALQKAAREFVTRIDELSFDSVNLATGVATRAIFEHRLFEFRAVVGRQVMELVAAYGLDVDNDIAQLIPFTSAD